MTNREWFEKRALAAKDCIQDLNDDKEERALAWAFDELNKLRSALEAIAGMKIPYCDGYDIACSMREEARDALNEKA